MPPLNEGIPLEGCVQRSRWAEHVQGLLILLDQGARLEDCCPEGWAPEQGWTHSGARASPGLARIPCLCAVGTQACPCPTVPPLGTPLGQLPASL